MLKDVYERLKDSKLVHVLNFFIYYINKSFDFLVFNIAIFD